MRRQETHDQANEEEAQGQITRCKICNKPLTDPESIAKGVGPICSTKVSFEARQLDMMGDFREDPEKLLEAMAKRSDEVHAIPCPQCGYKCLKPISWSKSTCIICKLNHDNHIFDL